MKNRSISFVGPNKHRIVTRMAMGTGGGVIPIADFSAWDCDKVAFSVVCRAVFDTDLHQVRRFNLAAHKPLVGPGTALHGSRFAGRFAGETLVLVAPGPSSAGLAGRLKPFAGKYRSMVCNAASGLLEKPDFFSVLDRNDQAAEKWMGPIDPGVTTLVTHPAASYLYAMKWERFRRNIAYYWLTECGEWDSELYKPLGMLAQARHVLVSSIHAAFVLGFKQVLLVGADFSTIPGGSYYSDGSHALSYLNARDDGQDSWREYFTLTGIDGEPCRSTAHLVADAHVMEVVCQIAKDAGMRVVNCSGRGILDIERGVLEDELSREA